MLNSTYNNIKIKFGKGVGSSRARVVPLNEIDEIRNIITGYENLRHYHQRIYEITGQQTQLREVQRINRVINQYRNRLQRLLEADTTRAA